MFLQLQYFIMPPEYFPVVVLRLKFLYSMPVKFFPKEELNQGCIKDWHIHCPDSPRKMKDFQIAIVIVAPSDNLEQGPLVLLGTANCCVLFFLTYISLQYQVNDLQCILPVVKKRDK